ncbi:ABC transporter permease [Naumannella cuiyingiana]|uniref:Osmoprotectant transport system permease protein n=1 Tax=Naumannella cuiyingiana TaxID=1347891 RepID=A0A7Z0D896_9ACTN|nr:ABC transporter permease [Naumannella cuiyingiana]NYI70765.1 osmoprotectant transport system permease protein [Naumannella cuiyingiana]
MNVAWIARNLDQIGARLVEHLALSIIPVVVALLIAIPLGYLVSRTGRFASVIITIAGLVYAIPSVALFVVMPLFLGTRILDPINVVVALTVYSLALLLRSVVDGFRSVPPAVRNASVAMGYGRARRVFGVELPLAMPVIFAGLRVVTVSNIALVTVGAVIGMGALGQYFDQGFREGFLTPIIVGIVLILILALLADLTILAIQRISLPWLAVTGRRGGAA